MVRDLQRQGKLAGLEAGRGIAALLVVMVHTWDHTAHGYGWFPLGALFTFGHAGVDFFFVLSGFIIFYVHERDIGRPERLGHYATRRFTRIFPFYWAILGLALVAAAFSRHPFPSSNAIVTSVLLAPTLSPLVIGVAWTLRFEVIFYAIFALLILRRPVGILAFAAWLMILLVFNVTGVAPPAWVAQSGLAARLASYFCLHFFFGMGAAYFLRRGRVPAPRLVLLASAALFLAIGLAEDAHLVYGPGILPHLGYALASTGAVLGLVEAERQGKLPVPRILNVLGSASYAIYLTHLLSVGAIWQILLALHLAPHLPPSVAFLILAAGAVVGGVVASFLIEKPVIALARRLLEPKPAAPAPVAT